VEHAGLVRHSEVANVAAKPLRPRFSEAALGTGREQGKQTSTFALSAPALLDEAQEADANQLGMRRHDARRTGGLSIGDLPPRPRGS
jgi:hypothetical protein